MKQKVNMKSYEKQILKIWNDFKELKELNEQDREYRKSPLLPIEIKKNAILFIGINPSFTKKAIIEKHNREIEFYPEIDDKKTDIQYFEKFKEVARYCDEKWTHLDLLFIRETNQKVIAKMIRTKKGIDFVSKQLDVSFEAIKKSNPKIIIVANSLASEFFGKKKKIHHSIEGKIWKGFNLDFDNDFDNKIGTYRISLNDKQVPIIFSGMLSGQRALDIGSLERLMWQINMILKKQ